MGLPTTSERSSTLVITSDDIWIEADHSGSDYGSEGYESYRTVDIEAVKDEKEYPNRIQIEYNYSFSYNGGSRHSVSLVLKIYKNNELFYWDDIEDSSFAKKHISDSLLSRFESSAELTENLKKSELDNVWVRTLQSHSEPLIFLQKVIQELNEPQSEDVKTFIADIKKDISDEEFRYKVVRALDKVFEPLNLCEDYEYDHEKNPVEIPPSSLYFRCSGWTNNSVECSKYLPVDIDNMVMGSYTPFIMLTLKNENGVQLYLTCDDWWPSKAVNKEFHRFFGEPELPTKDDLEKMKEKFSSITNTFGTLVSITDVEVIHINDYKKLFSQMKEPVFMVNCDIRGDQLIEDDCFCTSNHRGTAIVMIPQNSDLVGALQEIKVS